MSKAKKLANWTDFIAESSVPSVDYDLQPSNGTSFGLDSFEFDTSDGAGIEEGIGLPETRGLSQLPDGTVTTAEFYEDPALTDDTGIVLSQEDVGLPKEANIIDLQWLDPTTPQDPDRLPNNEMTLDSSPQLEEAWGANRQTDGVHLVPNNDLEALQYQNSIRDDAGGQHSGLPGVRNAAEEENMQEALKEAALRAVRRLHFGHDIKSIKVGLASAYGEDSPQLRKMLAAIDAEHGLMGKVYVRASAFPGLRNGTWVKELRRSCRTARYVITDDAAVANKLSMQQVSEVPWKEAYRLYAPLLTASGYKLASGDPRAALRQAFLKGPKISQAPETPFPVEQRPVATASAEEIQAELTAAAPTAQEIKNSETRALEAKKTNALAQIDRWVEGGFLSKDDSFQLHGSELSGSELLKTATALMTAMHNAPVYAGEGASLSEEARVARQQVWESVEVKQKAILAGRQAKLKLEFLRAVKSGLLTVEESKRIFAKNASIAETEKLFAAVIMAAQEKRNTLGKPVASAQYAGEGTGLTDVRPTLEAVQAPLERRQAAVQAHQDKKLKESILKEIKANRLTVEEARRIVAKGLSISETESLVAAVVLAAGEKRVAMIKGAETKTYEGVVMTEHVTASGSDFSHIPPQEVRGLLRWAQQKLTEGSLGTEFDDLLKARFSDPLLKAASGPLVQLRTKHEGLAGHVYVDAAAYASPEGAAGCEKHASKHRANNIKFVLAMPRCGSCGHKNADGYCTQYNKKLADEVPAENPAGYQKEMLRRANHTDAEVTGSMFNPKEFNLVNADFDEIPLDMDLPNEKLAEVVMMDMGVGDI